MKRPAAAQCDDQVRKKLAGKFLCQPIETIPSTFKPLVKVCQCCGGNLTVTGVPYTAFCVDLIGIKTVETTNLQCTSRNCRTTHMHNYYTDADKE